MREKLKLLSCGLNLVFVRSITADFWSIFSNDGVREMHQEQLNFPPQLFIL